MFGHNVKGVRCWFSVWVGISVGCGVDIGVGAGNVSAYGLEVSIDDWYDMGYSDVLFDGFSVGASMPPYVWITWIKWWNFTWFVWGW